MMCTHPDITREPLKVSHLDAVVVAELVLLHGAPFHGINGADSLLMEHSSSLMVAVNDTFLE